ncbi:MAG: argininosuccinate synthase [Dehalococcoidia bacterium]|nr:argininosuccinate synthase [Dehalococcoidia bacterium]
MIRRALLVLAILLMAALSVSVFPMSSVMAAGATTSVHIVKYAEDGVTVVEERTVTYQWLEKNLPKCGDGVTHYYHQGPSFDPDNLWDPNETVNLKDKGAAMGSSVKDLCDLVGGMDSDDEALLQAVDGWQIKFKYVNVYEPEERQGTIALCWYNGEDALEGERYGEGYPGNNGYRTALQIVVMAGTTNPDGKYVFGNSDMQAVMPPEEGYSHFYQDSEGFWPSTNGLSGKWIESIVIYPTGASPEVPEVSAPTEVPWLSIGLGAAGLLLVVVAVFLLVRKKDALVSPSEGSQP